MVCPRCISAVQLALEQVGASVAVVELGEVQLQEPLSQKQTTQLDGLLNTLGFERIDGRRNRIIEQVKNEIVNMVHHSDKALNVNLSDLLAGKLHYDYTYLSNLFSEAEGTTIEKYYIAQRIEKAKELLAYDELTLAQIADDLGYSSAAYLSSQFKKVTGLTPSHYKLSKETKRKNISEL